MRVMDWENLQEAIDLKKGGEKMNNLDYLKNRKEIDDGKKRDKDPLSIQVSEWEIEYRKMKALEIIAEELINLNSTLRSITITLEYIETAIIG